ncbi:protein phosphatase 1 regulatory subunit 15A [Brienomyrus brachyistius]|uniref:protein phosphatase 1 regulatory subunit 15A n=1 Tax=Brienomyrus brachyistius TaxID=42636 RepID=UPI0020B316CF|nr:protein phosphatase 1 regulatory subunit 15A [Brienomyrus brachyistius]
MCVDMAPFHSQYPSPHMFSVARDMRGVSMSERPTPLSTIVLPRMPRPKKGLEADWPARMRMFQVFHKAFRHLRAALFKIMSRCIAAVKALRPEAYPLPIIMDAVTDAPIDTATLGFGVLEDHMEECWVQDQGSTIHGWMWTPQLAGQGGSMVYALDEKTLGEDECVSSSDEAAFPEGYEGSEQDVDLSEWLEWDSCEVSSDGRNFLFEEAHEADPGKSSVSSEGPGWDSDSSWSDDDDDDDDNNSENAQLWESFFRTDDPYSLLSFSSVVKSQATCPPEGCTPKVRGMQVEVLSDEEEERRPLQEEMPTTGHKKVRFSEKVEVRPLVAWAFASRVSRDGSCWLQMARDRDRFRRRVEAASDVIGPVLLPQHRAAVWERLQMV